MVVFRFQYGAVYVFENEKAQRVKVGMTINKVVDRLRDVNDIWAGMKVTCQICGGRRSPSKGGLTPQHRVSDNDCRGGNELPLEKDVVIAKSHLECLKGSLDKLSGSEKGSVTRKIKKLEKRIELYQHYDQPAGIWELNTAYYTECAEHIELLSHEILSEHLDRAAPLGEVFCCSVAEATEAVESVLGKLGLLEAATKEIRDDSTSKEFGNCPMCSGILTERGTCPDCIKGFLHQK